jgi:murein L,D-transpeptidase YafK
MKRFKNGSIVITIVLIGIAAANLAGGERMRRGIMESIETLADRDFKQIQSKYPHVKTAIDQKQPLLESLFKKNNLTYPPEEIFLRGLKKEKKLELWVKCSEGKRFYLVKQYDFEKLSGVLGPKRKEGDLQVPEGFYYIDRYNPSSKFYLSLGLNYPNQSDRILSHRERPGFDIFIHGGASSIGCIPVGDEGMKEIYLLAVEARARGQKNIPVHIFPSRLNDEAFEELKKNHSGETELIKFWENLREGYELFEKKRTPPGFSVENSGRYIFTK